MLPIKIKNRSANKYQLAKHNVTDTKYKDWLLIYPPKRGNLPPEVNLPQIKKCCSTLRVQSFFALALSFCTAFKMHFCTKFGSGKWQSHGSVTEQATSTE